MKSINYHRVRQALSVAHESKTDADIPDGWQADAMRRIRNLRPEDPDSLMLFFNRLVWQFAAVACLLVVVLSLVSFQNNFQTEYELAKLLIEDPLNVSLMQSFGI